MTDTEKDTNPFRDSIEPRVTYIIKPDDTEKDIEAVARAIRDEIGEDEPGVPVISQREAVRAARVAINAYRASREAAGFVLADIPKEHWKSGAVCEECGLPLPWCTAVAEARILNERMDRVEEAAVATYKASREAAGWVEVPRAFVEHPQWDVVDTALDKWSRHGGSELVALGIGGQGFLILNEARRTILAAATNGEAE